MNAQRIDAAWAAFFGLSAPAFLQPGIQVVAHHELADYHGVWLFRHHASLCISVPLDLLEELRAAVRVYTIESLFNQAGIRAVLGPRIEQTIGPAYQGYVERPQFRPVTHPAVRALSRRDQTALQRLADASGAEAWEHGGIAFDEPHVVGCFVDDRLVAVARFRRAWGDTAHLGVVTHPAWQGHGYGRAVVSAATAGALDAGFIVLYQTLLANAPSVALATRLGYQPYATHLAVRLTAPPGTR
jgi:GNAT superfamily N-acetyltransferase